MPAKAKKSRESVSFDQYKAIKDEIIEISEQRFENILTKRLSEFKNSLMDELNIKFDAIDVKFGSIDSRFDAIDAKFNAMNSKFNAMDSKFNAMDSKFNAMDSKFNAMDAKFDSLEKRMTFLTWFLPLFMTILTVILKYFDKGSY